MADARSEEAASDVVESVHFRFYTPEEIRSTSVKRITKSDLLDTKNAPVPDGLYDPALGPLNDTDPCKSCGQLSVRCPGHCGHIDLAKPLYNPLLFRSLQNILQMTCFFCHKFKLNEDKVKKYVYQLGLIIKGDVIGARSLEDGPLSELYFPEEDSAESTSFLSNKSISDDSNSKHKTWTSFQYSEALYVLSRFMGEKRKKCDNCGRKNPAITSPTFGFLNKETSASDVRSNVILEHNLVLSSGETKDAETTDLNDDGGSQIDELPLPAKTAKGKSLSELPPELIKQLSSSGQKNILPTEVELILKDLWKNNTQMCNLMCDIQHQSLRLCARNKGYSMFFLKALLVPPNRLRPPAGTSGHEVLEHPQNILLSKVQEANIALRGAVSTNPDNPEILRRWMDLQKNVNVLFDSSKGFVKSEKEANGIRQMLEKKSGILRQKMMGKRVNFACRSVISPDPYLAVNEIGIPPYFALRLSYPERVTPWNVTKLRHAVINGADIHPGATHYKDKDRMCKLQVSRNMRTSISRRLPTSRGLTQQGKGPEPEFEGKVVYRHLQDGDIVLVNRQPTLHKASMMAHVVRVLKGEKTIRMHYANCSTYNADFDGDEMNVHLPQDEISRSEAINIVNANKQYIVPTSGEPIRGLIQDHIVSAVLLTKPDTFFTREEYFQLLQVSCVPASSPNFHDSKSGHKISPINSGGEIQPVDPAILKPIPLWTGKQVITAILNYVTRGHQPLTIKSDGRIQKEYLKQKKKNLVRIYDNELIDGIIDKAQFGSYGLVHAVQELYGADTAGILLSIFSRLFTSFLQMHGFTCGIDDLLLVQTSDRERKKILGKGEAYSKDVHVRFSGSKDGEKGPMELQREIEKVIRGNGESATIRLDRMMSSSMNTLTSEVNQCLFPYGLMKPFPKNCLSLMTTTGAKGGLVNMTQISSMLGQQELEGKRVPRMISGKSLPCFPPWDISSRAGGFIGDRFLTGLRPQEYYFHCMAGRDGLVDTAVKTSRSGYLQRCLIKNLEGLKVSYDHTVRDVDGSLIQFAYGEDGIDVLKASFLSKYKMLANNKKVIQKHNDEIEEAYLAKSNGFIEELPFSMEEKKATKMARSKKDELKSLYQINRYELKRSDFRKILKFKYFSSLAEPGEPVGVVAAQSIGEPSTQMTLNTFHLAGKAEANVTLGIPRLQEILMTASDNIRTPVMICPLFGWKTKDDAECLAAKLRRVSVADVVERMEVCSVPFSVHLNDVATMYKLKITLYPSELYPPHSKLTTNDCMSVLRTSFIDAMEDAIAKHIDMIHKISDINSVSGNTDSNVEEGLEEDETGNRSTHDGNGDGDNDDETDDDQGTDAEKRKRRASDEIEYDDDMQKESPDFAAEHDGELQSEYESGVVQVDADEDYLIGEGFCSSSVDSESPESPAKVEATSGMEDGERKPKSSKKGTRESALDSKKKQPKSRQSQKKIKRAVFLSAEGLKFEVHFVLRKEPCILLAEIAQKTAKNVYIKESKNISSCSVSDKEKDSDPFSLQTSGVNFSALWDMDECLDLNNLYSNDIHAMLNTYGVEAARATIIKEVMNVFRSYGIKVNIRHLSLIADFMTFQGGYRPMNRLGMGEFSTSPFGKMTFETATKFIVESAFHGEVDILESPSASVCLGQPVKMGTGCFELMQNLKL